MPLASRLLICLVIATPVSAVYYAWITTATLSFVFHLPSAAIFVLTSVVCVLLAGFKSSTNTTSARSSSNGASGTASKPTSTKKAAHGREIGTVKWFSGSKGFGFITRANGEEVFVHFRSMQKDSRRLGPGLDVEFAVVDGDKGPEASDVVVV